MTITVTDTYSVASSASVQFTNESGFVFVRPYGAEPIPRLAIDGTVTVTASKAMTLIGIDVHEGLTQFGSVSIGALGSLSVTAAQGGYTQFGFLAITNAPDFLNKGLVEVGAAGDAIGLESHALGWSLDNLGSIKIASSSGYAVAVASAGVDQSIRNSGEITVHGYVESIGIRADLWGIKFINTGQITAISDGPDIKSSAVLWNAPFTPGTSFTNNGLLVGDYALKSTGYATAGGKVLYTNNGTMIGKVGLGDAGATLINNGSIQGAVVLGSGADVYDGHLGALKGPLDAGAGNDLIAGNSGAETLSGAPVTTRSWAAGAATASTAAPAQTRCRSRGKRTASG